MEGGRRGFSLVELAIVLTIIGIIMSIGIKSCISGITTAKSDKTKDNLDILKTFIERNICKNGKFSFAIPENLKIDGWNNQITIINATSINNESPCLLNATNLTAEENSTSYVYNNVAVILISKGENQKLDSKILSNKVILKPDDLYSIITLNELKSKCCKGKELKIITPFLPPIVENATYSVTIAVNGNYGNYTWSITSSDYPSVAEILQNGTKRSTKQPYTTINLSCNDTSKIATILSSASTAKITISVKNKNQKTTKNFVLTIIRR